jgi:hypothetical protein
MFSNSGSHLRAKVGCSAVTCPAILCEPWASSIKKGLAGLLTQSGSPIPNAHTHISKTAGVMAIMGLQDVRADGAVKTYKTYREAAIVRR